MELPHKIGHLQHLVVFSLLLLILALFNTTLVLRDLQHTQLAKLN